MTDLEDLDEVAGKLIDKYNNLSGIKRNNTLFVLASKFKSFENRCLELTEEQYVQVLNPQTNKWIKVEISTGKIVSHKRTKGEYERIRKVDSISEK